MAGPPRGAPGSDNPEIATGEAPLHGIQLRSSNGDGSLPRKLVRLRACLGAPEILRRWACTNFLLIPWGYGGANGGAVELEISAETARKRSTDDLQKSHAYGHDVTDPATVDHP
jgi:hypothetical protein